LDLEKDDSSGFESGGRSHLSDVLVDLDFVGEQMKSVRGKIVEDMPELTGSAATKDTETLHQLGYVREIDETVSRYRIFTMTVEFGLSSFVSRIAASYGAGLDENCQVQIWI
jgi:hypothetical protein